MYFGGGAILDGKPLEEHINHKKVVPAFDEFIQCIKNGILVDKKIYENTEVSFNKFITSILAKVLSYKVTKRLKKYGYNIKELI